MSSFYLQQLINNPDYLVKIILPNGQIVKGFLESEFGFSGSAEWSSMSDALGGDASKLQTATNVGTAAVNSATGGTGSAPVLKTFAQTVLDFVGTNNTDFSVNIKLIALKPDDNLLTEYKKLIPAVFSEENGLGTMKAPFGYQRSLTKLQAGGCTLAIGTWFRASQLIIKSVAPTFSREIISNGTPLYVNIAVTLSVFRSPSSEDVMGWFRK